MYVFVKVATSDKIGRGEKKCFGGRGSLPSEQSWMQSKKKQKSWVNKECPCIASTKRIYYFSDYHLVIIKYYVCTRKQTIRAFRAIRLRLTLTMSIVFAGKKDPSPHIMSALQYQEDISPLYPSVVLYRTWIQEYG